MSNMVYSLTIGFTICTAVFILRIGIPPEWHSLFLEPNLTVASILACRLVRELKLGVYEDLMTQHAISKIVFRDIGNSSQQQSGCTSEPRTHDSADMCACDVKKRHDGDVENQACYITG